MLWFGLWVAVGCVWGWGAGGRFCAFVGLCGGWFGEVGWWAGAWSLLRGAVGSGVVGMMWGCGWAWGLRVVGGVGGGGVVWSWAVLRSVAWFLVWGWVWGWEVLGACWILVLVVAVGAFGGWWVCGCVWCVSGVVWVIWRDVVVLRWLSLGCWGIWVVRVWGWCIGGRLRGWSVGDLVWVVLWGVCLLDRGWRWAGFFCGWGFLRLLVFRAGFLGVLRGGEEVCGIFVGGVNCCVFWGVECWFWVRFLWCVVCCAWFVSFGYYVMLWGCLGFVVGG